MSVFVFCDHGGNEGQDGFDDLGLEPDIWRSHFAYDIGAAALTSELAARFSTTPVIQSISRLYADPNRDPADPACVPVLLGDRTVPGNAALDTKGRIARIQSIHEPYHRRLAHALGAHRHAHARCGALSVHTFTPEFEGEGRVVSVAFLTKHDRSTADFLLGGLQARFPDLVMVHDDPYSGWLYNYTVDRHFGALDMPHALIEVRNDLASKPAFRHELCEALARLWFELLEGT
jgi:predicted N-formylglutamate amidohydrolase